MELIVNGAAATVDDGLGMQPLLWTLRERIGERGVKFGCGVGACAACTVHVDGVATKSCQTATRDVVGKRVTVLSANPEDPAIRATQQAWYDMDVVQCGYCQPGQILAAAAYIAATNTPDDQGIDEAMSGNICRCGTYPRIRAAIYRAAELLSSGAPTGQWPVPIPDADDGSSREELTGDDRYVQLQPDGTLLVRCSQLEMGQGAFTTVATLVAEELDFPLQKVRVVHAANAPAAFGNPLLGGRSQVTGGSTGARVYAAIYRQAAARLRARILQAAADTLGSNVASLAIVDGAVRDPASGAELDILPGALAGTTAPADAPVKTRSQFALVGNDGIHRVDSPAKITGTARYTLDVAWPDMLTAAVIHPPQLGATVKGFDAAAARALPGIADVIQVRTGVAVAADSFTNAAAAADKVAVTWDTSGAETRSGPKLLEAHYDLLQDDAKAIVVSRTGEPIDAAPTLEATYDVPYLTHAPMEPTNAACRMRDDGFLEVWCAYQVPEAVLVTVADAAGLPVEQIDLHIPFAGGSFGLHTVRDPAAVIEAVEVAKALDWANPVKVQNLRSEEITQGMFRPMAVGRMRGIVDDEGALTSLAYRVVVQSVSETQLPKLKDLFVTDGVDAQSIDGATAEDVPFDIPNYTLELTPFESPIPVGTLRSVSETMNEFARESFLDELADHVGMDPVEYRMRLLHDNPRGQAVVERLVREARWGADLGPDRAQGMAGSASFGSHSAQVMEVTRHASGAISVDKITFVIDCGRLISPDQVLAQIQGNLMYALGAAMYGEVKIVDGSPTNRNLDTYLVARMRDTPEMNIIMIDSDEPPGGIGEVAGATVHPALANAISRLTGQRIRSAPFSKSIRFTFPRAVETAGAGASFTTTKNGPLLVKGEVALSDADGVAVIAPAADAIALCRCGESKNKPFCDGSHVAAGFDGALNSPNRQT